MALHYLLSDIETIPSLQVVCRFFTIQTKTWTICSSTATSHPPHPSEALVDYGIERRARVRGYSFFELRSCAIALKRNDSHLLPNAIDIAHMKTMMPSKRHRRLVVASLLIIFSADVSVINGFSIITSCARQYENPTSILMMSSSTNMIEGYEYIHPDIAQMLIGDRQLLSDNGDPITLFPFVVDPDTLTLQLKQQTDPLLGEASIMPMNQLQNFANYCDDIVFGKSISSTLNVPDKILGLISLSQLSSVSSDSAIVVASMVSVNLLESSIRSVLQRVRPQNKHQSKGAPLLSNMIEELSKLDIDPSMEYNKPFPLAHLSPILKALLLPTKVGGINLRNLLSHGFVSTLDRRWLSLTLVLIQTLDSCCVNVDDGNHKTTKQRDISDISSLAKYDLMKREIDFGKAVLSSNSRMQQLESPSCGGAFVPSSHQNLLRFTLHKSQEQPEDVSEQQQYQKTSIGILESACIIHSQPPPTLDPITSSRNMYWIFFCCHSMVP